MDHVGFIVEGFENCVVSGHVGDILSYVASGGRRRRVDERDEALQALTG